MWDAVDVERRLQSLAEQDPAFYRHGTQRHRYRLGPRLSAAQLERFEAQYGVELPASYRAFLLEVGDGGAGPYFGMFRHDGSDWNDGWRALDEREPGFLATQFPHTERFQPFPDVPACARHAPEQDFYDPCWITGSMVLAEFGCGAYFRLVVTGPARGQVWFDDLGCDQGLTPGPDFRDWYQNWLANPPALTPMPIKSGSVFDNPALFPRSRRA